MIIPTAASSALILKNYPEGWAGGENEGENKEAEIEEGDGGKWNGVNSEE